MLRYGEVNKLNLELKWLDVVMKTFKSYFT